MYVYIFIYIYIYMCVIIMIYVIKIHKRYNPESNVPSKLSLQWLCGSSCPWAYE